MANKNFPYHIRTTQIGVMEVQGIAGASTIDQFSHHVYQPTTIEQAVIIPLHPHTDDIFTTSQRLPRIQEPRDSDDENSDEETKRHNKNIDNVLKWSTVKGYVSPLANGETSRTGIYNFVFNSSVQHTFLQVHPDQIQLIRNFQTVNWPIHRVVYSGQKV